MSAEKKYNKNDTQNFIIERMASIRNKEELVQAVLIADTYDKRFYPFAKTGSAVSFITALKLKCDCEISVCFN